MDPAGDRTHEPKNSPDLRRGTGSIHRLRCSDPTGFTDCIIELHTFSIFSAISIHTLVKLPIEIQE